jgi:hypothetical protein
MDIWTTFPAFKRLVEQGHFSGQIFESKSTIITTVGAMTLIAQKPNGAKFFPNSWPLLRTGYRMIATDKEEPIDANEVIESLLDYAEFLDVKQISELIDKLKEKLEENR